MARSVEASSGASTEAVEAFYVMQQRLSGLLKCGRCLPGRVDQRRREHETSGGPHRLVYLAPHADKAFERAIFYQLRKFRLKGETRTDYEIFRPAPEVWAFYGSATARELGFALIQKPYPDRHTCRRWLLEAEAFGCKAATFALREERRLRLRTPASARGGWVLWELISGRLTRQLLLPLECAIESHGVASASELNGWPIHLITYRGVAYRFPVFREACERMGLRPPRNAIAVGIMPRSHRVPSGRKGQPLRKRDQTAQVLAVSEDQLALFGASQ